MTNVSAPITVPTQASRAGHNDGVLSAPTAPAIMAAMASIHEARIAAWLDHAYAPSTSLTAWLQRLTEDFAAMLPGVVGAVGRLVRTAPGRPPQLLGPYTTAADDRAYLRALDDHRQRSQHRLDLVSGGAELRDFRKACARAGEADRYTQAMIARFERIGVRNLHHLTASDDAGHVVSVGVSTRTLGRPEGSRLTWAILAAHLESAFRLQVRFQTDLRGAVQRLDAPPPTRAVIPPAARARAQEVWSGLLDGTWSTVARRDHAGRRYVVAIPSARTTGDARALSRREAQVAALVASGRTDKEIAFDLGIARSTVAGYVRDVLWKFGVRSRLAFVTAFRTTRDPRGEVP